MKPLSEPTAIFIAVQRGVYRHKIVAACTTLDRAKEVGEAAIAAESDHYHNIEIVLRQVNEQGPEVLVGTLTARCGNSKLEPDERGQMSKVTELLGIDWTEGDE